ncbi:disintegrin and metalloproteinase domain-containing protein 21-like [Rhinolophus ferrumequinum]|uniref:disintegrin and metalloproteinase domain-containing protein 21-like n=1 Tax=Rhinolophus ferrumequinum TaxID=59479 RepID=UPI00140F8021|nr:disintegrin and metalloproteinase domain-containing protein 21-like [Rhinolophus ferrumequinum]
MQLAEGQVTLRTPLLLLGLWVALSPVQCSQGRPSWRYISSEVVIPRKETHRGRGVPMLGWLSYSLHFGGQRHVIHMRRKKLFWPRHLLLMTQDDQGALQIDDPFVPLDCYYLGYLEKVPLSMVTMDTCCGGLEGIMKLDDLAYEIKPLKDSQRFEHVVSQIVADTNATGPTYRLGFKEDKEPLFSQANASAASRISSKLYASHRANMKGCIIAAHSIYTLFRNMSQCAHYLRSMGSLLNSMYKSLDIRYYIGIMVIYHDREPTTMSYYRVPGSPFFKYYERVIYQPLLPHSALVMIRSGPHERYFSPVFQSICDNQNLVMLGHLGRHYLLLAIIGAHQIGRTIGLHYDTNTCVCQRRTTCIMNRYPVLTDVFSNCSFLHLQNILGDFPSCMYMTDIVYTNRTMTVAQCGDNVVDENEQCDCGSFKHCYSNACCNSDCSLTAGSACDAGRCCTNCTYSPAGTLCRPIQNVCDLPEYCLGSTFTCPENVYLQDGTPCTEEGYCYHGNCTDRTMHCREIFGEGALQGPDICYNINRKGHRFGHCRKDAVAFKPEPCNERDITCGRLQCTNVTHLPRLQEHVGFHQSLISGVLCFGVDLHRGTETTDIGHVRPGTPCGFGKFCLNTYCTGTMAEIIYDCEPSKCNLRGVCNNRKNCHCHVGWEPPDCILTGAGGSVNSGPPPRRMRSVSQNIGLVVYFRVVVGRMYTFVAAILFGLATNVRTIKITVVTAETVGTK